MFFFTMHLCTSNYAQPIHPLVLFQLCVALASLPRRLCFVIVLRYNCVLYRYPTVYSTCETDFLLFCSLFSRIKFKTQFITVQNYEASKTSWQFSNNFFQVSCVQVNLFLESLLQRVFIDVCHTVIMEVEYVEHFKGKNFLNTDFINQDQFTMYSACEL